MKLKFLLTQILLACTCAYGYAEEQIDIKETPPPPPPTHKHRAPAKRNVEAWLDGTVMTIVFTTSEGDATLSLETSDGFITEEMVYSTEAPIVIDLAPFGEVTSFTVETEAGHTYVGYLQ